MIDLFAVFTRGGVLLWRHELAPMGVAPLNGLVTRVLLEEKTASASFRHGNHSLKWALDNRRGLVFVAAFLTRSSLPYVDDLVAAVRKAFVARFDNDRLKALPARLDFDDAYLRIVDRMETRALGEVTEVAAAKRAPATGGEQPLTAAADDNDNDDDDGDGSGGGGAGGGDDTGCDADASNAEDEGAEGSSGAAQTGGEDEGAGGGENGGENGEGADVVATLLVQRRRQRKPRQFSESRKAANIEKTRADGTVKAAFAAKPGAGGDGDDGDDGDDDGGGSSSASSAAPRLRSPTERLAARRRGGAPRAFQKKKKDKQPASSPPSGKASKKPRRFDQMTNGDEPAVLDFSKDSAEDFYASPAGGKTVDSSALYASESDDDDDDDDDDGDDDDAAPGGGGLFGFFSKLTGQVLDEEALRPVLDQMRLKLTERNVAADIAEKLVASLGASLVGKKAGTFSTIKGMVREATEEALARILTPKRSVDVLQGIVRARAEGRPYVVVVLGVNGVGKSTSLAKLTSYLLSKNFSVSIAACDTFRSGAVEQLRTHGRALGVTVFEQGYQKDSSAVATAGIRAARKRGDDVVLVDTAGRMTNAEPLMRSIAKLVTANKPDLVLFVGEAVCGGDAVEQLTGFNRALVDFSPEQDPITVGGIVLSKYDTVDDNVGTAISLTYTSGVPILFVGTGQSYGDLKRCNSKLLIRQLLR